MQVDVKGLSYQEIEQIADHYSHIYGLKVLMMLSITKDFRLSLVKGLWNRCLV